jgi:hypothetical protein
LWSARCRESGTPGAGSDPEKRTGRKTGTALRVDFHHPHSVQAASPIPSGRQQLAEHAPDRTLLSHPELTGMPRQQLDGIATALAQSQAAQREQSRRIRRGTERRRAAGAGAPTKLTDADRVLATVLYLRRLCTQTVLAELFGVDRSVITKAVRDVRPLLHQHGHTITPSTARFPAPADLLAFLADADTEPPSKIKSAC